MGKSGNDLHYRGYDILDLANACEFQEVAYLLVHGRLPNIAELTAYKISETMGTAVTVQAMVFGNRGLDSRAGVGFTRDPEDLHFDRDQRSTSE